MDVQVRPVASPTEFRAALLVNRAAWRDAYADILPAAVLEGMTVPDGPDLQRRYEAATEGERTFLVAVDREPGAVVGFVDLLAGEGRKAFCGPADAELRALYVRPDRQREGIGARLLAGALEGLEELDTPRERVALEVFTANDPARRFYEAVGFERVGESAFEVDGEAYPTTVYAAAADLLLEELDKI